MGTLATQGTAAAGAAPAPKITRRITQGRTRRATVLGLGRLSALALPATGVLAACNTTSSPGGGGASTLQFKEPVTLDYQHRWDGVREPLMQEAVDTFAKVQPNIKINNQMVITSAPGNAGGMPVEKIIAQISAGTPPDVVMLQSPITNVWAQQSLVQKLDDLAKRDKFVPEQVFYPSLAKLGQLKGSQYGLPIVTAGSWSYLFQNAESFQAAGLDYKKTPQSWEELVTFSTRLTQKQGSGFSKIGFNLPYGGATNFIHWLPLNDGKLLSDDATKVAFDTPQGLETLEWMLDSTNRVYGSRAALEAYLAEIGADGAAGVSRGIDAAQYQGKIGMWTQSVAFFYIIKTEATNFNAAFQYGAGLIPHNTKNPRAKQSVLDDTVWVYDIPQGSKKTDAAWEWIKYITAGEGNRRFNLTQFRPSPVVKYNDDPEFSKNNPHWDVVKKQLSLSQPLPQTPGWAKVNTSLTNMVRRVLSGQVSPKEALAAAAQEGQLALDEVRR